jgi:hypothetical protein
VGAVAASAAIKWIIKDGIGAAGRFLVGGRLGREFDDDPRRWRMVAEAITTLGEWDCGKLSLQTSRRCGRRVCLVAVASGALLPQRQGLKPVPAAPPERPPPSDATRLRAPQRQWTAGLALEISTSLYPQHFLLLASSGNFAKALAKGMGKPVFRVVQTHFAASGNVGAVAAKEEVWEVSAQLAGYAASVAVLSALEDAGE